MAVETLGLEMAVEGLNKFLSDVKKGDDAVEDSASKWEKLSGVAGKAGQTLGTVAKVGFGAIAAGAVAAVAAVGGLAVGIGKLAMEAAEVEGTVRTFDALNQSIGTDGPAALAQLRDATRGMVSDQTLMEAGNKFIAMGLAESADEAANLAEVATQLGLAMGEDAAGSMENFALMMANQSIPRLDSFGISSGKVRERINELMKETAGMTREAAFNQAVMEQAAVTMEKVGEQGDTAGAGMARMRATFENAKLQIGQAFLPVLGELMGTFSGLVEEVLPTVMDKIEILAAWIGENLPIAIENLRTWWEETWPIISAKVTEVWAILQPVLANLFEWLSVNIPVALEFLGNAWDIYMGLWKAYIGWIVKNIFPLFEKLWNTLKTDGPSALSKLAEFWKTVLLPAIQTIWNFIQMNVIPLLIQLWQWVSENLPIALEKLRVFWVDVLLPAIQTVWAFIQDNLIPLLILAWEWISENLPIALEKLRSFWENVLLPAIKKVWEFVQGSLFPLFEALTELLKVTLAKALEVVAALWKNVLLPALESVWKIIKDNVLPVIMSLIEFLDKTARPILEWFAEVMLENIKQAFDDITRFVRILVSVIDDWIQKMKGLKLPDWLQPGSPTPLEMGVRGITSAIQTLNRQGLPQLQVELAGAGALASAMEAQIQAAVSPAIGGGASSTNNISSAVTNNYNLTTNSTTRPGSLALEFQAMGMASR